ncbi:MAG: glycosyltransferase [Mucilaginibacter sp.]|uniref:glycosyltransferase n=1 Tax=Mucilaginibacter sp. TaxID=1882438 RepID=UPI003266A8EE
MVTTRRKVGILFSYSEGWIGGSYYFINLVYALKQLDDDQKPHVVIVSESEAALDIIKQTGYPYLSYIGSRFQYNFVERCINKLSRIVFKKSVIQKDFPAGTIDVLFGYYEQLFRFEKSRKIFWIPDLQDKHYPQYLGADIAASRKAQHEALAYTNSEVLFSSNDSKNDFDTFYPKSICKKYVVQFAVTLPKYSDLPFEEVAAKFGVSQPYFFSPNQFWSHKNHFTVIKAVEILKKKNIEVTVVFTGNEKTGGGAYANELKEYVSKAGLQANCLFLGFIDRKEQLVLMQNAKAIIQPSLFEGWSTVVEDSKCMNKYLILSDLKVHHEQISENVNFFSPTDPDALAVVIADLLNNEITTIPKSYEPNLLTFAKGFLNAINNN